MSPHLNNSNDRPRQRSVFYRITHWLRKGYFPSLPPREVSIHLVSDGFEVHDGDCLLWEICWDEVTRVVAFKLDRISIDTICVGFQRTHDTECVWRIEEEWNGYKIFDKKLNEFTNGEWHRKWIEIAQPAFEFNWNIIWDRPDAPPLVEDPILIWRSAPETPDPSP